MGCCSQKTQKVIVFCTSIFLIIIGLILIFSWQDISSYITRTELSLKNENTQQFQFWKEAPIPIYLEIHLFNWTNAADFKEGKPWTTKPEFTEFGPYIFREIHTRANIEFNDNNTVSFNTIRTWHFVPEKTRGSLDDNVTTLNPIAMTVGNLMKHKSILLRRGVNTLFKEKKVPFIVTKTVREFLFDGYNDTFLDLLHKLDLKDIKIPFDKFGWFYSRNGSVFYDGKFTINTGADDLSKLGIITRWNQSPRSHTYAGYCGLINGTTGEVWYPLKKSKSISIFLPDTCSSLTLEMNGSYSAFGLEGNIYAQTNRLFDNGTKYLDMDCFSPGVHLPTGVRNISECKFGAPAFMSMPHFYMADPSYRKAVKGMYPDPSRHSFYLALEPNTGLPLKIDGNLQVNLYLENISGIDMFQHVPRIMMPAVWFRQQASITGYLALLGKLLIVLPKAGTLAGYVLLGIGSLLLLIGLFITLRNGSKDAKEEPTTIEYYKNLG
ncbi:hypothetical protein HHI36_011046 [Cryptolaemus montrouzieri]|uniref:Protein croquemort n=1 Tax=Cryptolaemus montrouzieri TaxID=559131 RepID=A0ABD2MKK4_9CUCU